MILCRTSFVVGDIIILDESEFDKRVPLNLLNLFPLLSFFLYALEKIAPGAES